MSVLRIFPFFFLLNPPLQFFLLQIVVLNLFACIFLKYYIVLKYMRVYSFFFLKLSWDHYLVPRATCANCVVSRVILEKWTLFPPFCFDYSSISFFIWASWQKKQKKENRIASTRLFACAKIS